MCCINNPICIEELKKRARGRKWIKLWKVFKIDGTTPFRNFQLYPGTHRVKETDYCTEDPRGFHVWVDRHLARCSKFGMEKVLPIYCNMDTLLAASFKEAVFGEIKILKKDWNKIKWLKRTNKDNWIKLRYTADCFSDLEYAVNIFRQQLRTRCLPLHTKYNKKCPPQLVVYANTGKPFSVFTTYVDFTDYRIEDEDIKKTKSKILKLEQSRRKLTESGMRHLVKNT